MIDLPVAIAAQQPATQSQWWWTPIIGFLGIIVGSMWSSARERRGRKEESQRAALYALQDASLAARKAIRAYGEVPVPSRKQQDRLDDATAKFQALEHRILCETVRQRCQAWLPAAQSHYSGDPETTFAMENEHWSRLQESIGVELRVIAG